MSDADRINRTLATHAPALFRCLSPLGRRVVFPHGIPAQASAAAETRLNGTIGQITDGAGSPLPLPVLEESVPGLDRRQCFLYAPQPGYPEVRKLWRERQLRLAGRTAGLCSLPFATHGLTHGISLIADLLVDEETTVILPDPSWENYELLFTMRVGARIATYPFYRDGRFNLEGLADQLEQAPGKVLVVLNFPANPTGYSPTVDEARHIVDCLANHKGPAVFLIDDAYQGVVHEQGLLGHSLHWQLADAVDPERAVVLKVDGATKEVLFFPSRLGFVSASIADEAVAAWENKLNCVVRGTIGGPSGPAQAMLLKALRAPERTAREFAEVTAIITDRYRALQDALAATTNPRLIHYPFNSAYFALIGLAPSVSAEEVRKRLITERSVGTIAIPSVNALRVAYCSTRSEDVTAIVQHIDAVVASS
jgi:aspartate/methionine/tyrosine aminotransferase